MTGAIEVEGLTKRFEDVVALDGIDFEVPVRSVFGLLGPNGAGKTTAIRILATVLEPDAGSARVLGHDVAQDPEAVRRVIGMAGQFAAVDPNLTGRENLRLIGLLTQMETSAIMPRATELLERFRLDEAADRPLRTYSGGMRRRLDIAAALVPRPPVLFLDEPTTGLDLISRNELWDMIRELVNEGTTVLLTTQYLEEADKLAERIAVVDHGHVIADDRPSVLKAQLGSTVAELGFEDEAGASRAVSLLAASHDGAELDGSTVRLTTNDGPRVLIGVLRELDRADLSPATLAVHEPSLDDVFLALTGHRAESEEMPAEPAARERPALVRAVRDARAVTWRYLIHYKRVPQLLVFSTIQPVIFVLMFRYVFGGAIDPPGDTPYVEFLMPGIFVQTVVFGAIATAIGLATDMKSGLLERFRSLPMARSAVLAGRTMADLTRNVFVVLLMVAVGFAVGFRVHTGLWGLVSGLLLLLFFGYALSWIFATIGLWVGDPETAQAAAFPLIAPLVFASSLFVPIESMPSWLQPWAEHQPVSVTATAVRDLMLGGTDTAYHVAQSLAWCVGILLVFAPLAVRRYRRAV